MYIISRCIYCVNTQILIVATTARLVSIPTPAIQPIPTVAMSLPKDMDMEARSCSLANQRPAVIFCLRGVLTFHCFGGIFVCQRKGFFLSITDVGYYCF